jgi:hypothetical protein
MVTNRLFSKMVLTAFQTSASMLPSPFTTMPLNREIESFHVTLDCTDMSLLAGKPVVTLVYTMTNVQISSLSYDQMLIEQLELQFEEVEIAFTDISSRQTASATFNLVTNI